MVSSGTPCHAEEGKAWPQAQSLVVLHKSTAPQWRFVWRRAPPTEAELWAAPLTIGAAEGLL